MVEWQRIEQNSPAIPVQKRRNSPITRITLMVVVISAIVFSWVRQAIKLNEKRACFSILQSRLFLHFSTSKNFSWTYIECIGEPLPVDFLHEQFEIRGDCLLQTGLATNLHNHQIWRWHAWLFRWNSELLLHSAMGIHGYSPNCNHNLLIYATPSIKSTFEAVQRNGINEFNLQIQSNQSDDNYQLICLGVKSLEIKFEFLYFHVDGNAFEWARKCLRRSGAHNDNVSLHWQGLLQKWIKSCPSWRCSLWPAISTTF